MVYQCEMENVGKANCSDKFAYRGAKPGAPGRIIPGGGPLGGIPEAKN